MLNANDKPAKTASCATDGKPMFMPEDLGGAIALHPHVIAGYWQCAQFVSVDELLVKTWKNLS